MRKRDYSTSPVPELEEVVSLLKSGKMRTDFAIEEVKRITGDKPSWQQKWWREKRKELLDTACSYCGSQKQPLVLQHLYHPPKLMSLHSQNKTSWQEWLAINPYPSLTSENLRQRDCCPHCKSVAIRHRKADGAYICTRCKKQIYPPFPQVADFKHIAEIKQAHYKRYQTETKLPSVETIIMWVEGQIRYLSFKDVVTACKKCAYRQDVHIINGKL